MGLTHLLSKKIKTGGIFNKFAFCNRKLIVVVKSRNMQPILKLGA